MQSPGAGAGREAGPQSSSAAAPERQRKSHGPSPGLPACRGSQLCYGSHFNVSLGSFLISEWIFVALETSSPGEKEAITVGGQFSQGPLPGARGQQERLVLVRCLEPSRMPPEAASPSALLQLCHPPSQQCLHGSGGPGARQREGTPIPPVAGRYLPGPPAPCGVLGSYARWRSA